MVRNTDYESRRRAVLAAAIDCYIRDAEPVASEDIARDFGLSSATIRNIFSELEKAGYIRHPYTSAGRIPTNKGYRYYVDFLLSQMELIEAEKKRIIGDYKKEMRKLEDALEQTSEIISRVTHYAGIVSLLDSQGRLYYNGISQIMEQPEFKDMQRMRAIVKTFEEKNDLLSVINREFKQKVTVYIGNELGCPGMEDCSLVVSAYRIKDRPSGRVAVLGPARMEYGHTISALEYVSDVLSQVLDAI